MSCDHPGSKYSELVFNGLWFSPEREALQALITEAQRDVTGLVRLKFHKGNMNRRRLQKSEESLRFSNRHDGRRHVGIRPERRHRFHSPERA